MISSAWEVLADLDCCYENKKKNDLIMYTLYHSNFVSREYFIPFERECNLFNEKCTLLYKTKYKEVYFVFILHSSST